MTAAHQRPALEIVPDPDDTLTATSTPDVDDWRAASVIDQYSPEHQLIGSLMWLTADAARSLLEMVPDTAIWRPQTRWAYELIRRVVAGGDTPTPPTVLAAGRRHAAGDALDPAAAPTPTQHHQLALYLYDAYSQALAPNVAAGSYAREVLDEAYRRAFDTCGIRMQQLAAEGTERADLTAQFAAIRDELADLWRRADAAAKPESARS
jgi:replicative DNA helicase